VAGASCDVATGPVDGCRKRQRRCHDEEDCAICLSSLADGGAVTLTECDHAFHKRCLDAWLERSELPQPVCPICRSTIGDGVVVTIRGIDFEVSSRPTKPIAHAIQSAMDCFAHKFGAFTFRWPLPLSEEDVMGVSNLEDGSPLCLHQPLQSMKPDAHGRRRLLLATRPDRDWIPNEEFQWGQLMLNREHGELPAAGTHPSTSEYYVSAAARAACASARPSTNPHPTTLPRSPPRVAAPPRRLGGRGGRRPRGGPLLMVALPPAARDRARVDARRRR